jgi:hypothetical protein
MTPLGASSGGGKGGAILTEIIWEPPCRAQYPLKYKKDGQQWPSFFIFDQGLRGRCQRNEFENI